MSDSPNDTLDLEDRFHPDALPSLAIFLAGPLARELERPDGSAARAAWEHVEEAEMDELGELARDWDVLRRLAAELPIGDVRRLVAERFASAWRPESRAEIDAVAAELERALSD